MVEKVQLTREQRVAHVRGMMNRGEWRGRLSLVDLAERWDLTESAMRGISAEASKQLRLLNDDETLETLRAERERWIATCERVIAEAFARKRHMVVAGVLEEVASPDLKTVQATLEMLARAKGIVLAPTTADLTTRYVSVLLESLPGPLAEQVRAELQGQRAQDTVRIVLQRADGGITFTDGSANDSKSCALASGVVYCRAAPTAADTTPLMVRMRGAAGLAFTAVEGSLHAACALNTDGRIMCWGGNAHYLFARGGTVVADTGPIAVRTTRRFSAFSHGGHAQTCGVDRTDSGVYCWGHNDAYQLGRGFRSGEDSSVSPVGGNLRGSMVSTVNFSTCLLDLSGAAFCSGFLNVNRRTLGIDETTLPAEIPLPVIGGLTFKSLSAADNGVCGISSTDDAYCWGQNGSGQLGIGTTSSPPTGPQRVLGGLKFGLLTTVYRSSTCGITLDGDLYCWGGFVPFSISSRLGERALRPHHLIKGIKFKSLTRNVSAAICGLTTDGRVYCWN